MPSLPGKIYLSLVAIEQSTPYLSLSDSPYLGILNPKYQDLVLFHFKPTNLVHLKSNYSQALLALPEAQSLTLFDIQEMLNKCGLE